MSASASANAARPKYIISVHGNNYQYKRLFLKFLLGSDPFLSCNYLIRTVDPSLFYPDIAKSRNIVEQTSLKLNAIGSLRSSNNIEDITTNSNKSAITNNNDDGNVSSSNNNSNNANSNNNNNNNNNIKEQQQNAPAKDELGRFPLDIDPNKIPQITFVSAKSEGESLFMWFNAHLTIFVVNGSDVSDLKLFELELNNFKKSRANGNYMVAIVSVGSSIQNVIDSVNLMTSKNVSLDLADVQIKSLKAEQEVLKNNCKGIVICEANPQTLTISNKNEVLQAIYKAGLQIMDPNEIYALQIEAESAIKPGNCYLS